MYHKFSAIGQFNCNNGISSGYSRCFQHKLKYETSQVINISSSQYLGVLTGRLPFQKEAQVLGNLIYTNMFKNSAIPFSLCKGRFLQMVSLYEQHHTKRGLMCELQRFRLLGNGTFVVLTCNI